MSSRRSRQQQSGSSRISDDQIIQLVSKLQQLVPEVRQRRSDKVNKPTYHFRLSVIGFFSLKQEMLIVQLQAMGYLF